MSYLGLSEHIDFEALPDPVGRFRLENVIGEGTYGEVFQAFDIEMGETIRFYLFCSLRWYVMTGENVATVGVSQTVQF